MTGIFAAEGPNGNWIPGDPNEFYWGSVAFLIILLLRPRGLFPRDKD